MRADRAVRLRRRLLGGVAVAACALAAGASIAGLLSSLERSSVDTRFAVRGAQAPPDDLVVVGIDDVTFDELGVQWPFRRDLHARVIDRLRRDGVKVVAFDVQFTEQSTAVADEALIESVRRAGNVVLATTEVDENAESKVFGGGEGLVYSRAMVGDTTFSPDPGDIIRRMARAPQGLESFAAVTARAAGAQVDPFPQDPIWIDYHGPPRTIPLVPYVRVLRGQFRPGTFRDKVVVIGPVAPSLQDVHPTSTTGRGLMSGAEIQANAISTVRRGLPLRDAPDWLRWVLIAVLGAVPALLALRCKPPGTVGGAALAGGALLVGAQGAFLAGTVVTVVHPLLALGLSTMGTVAVQALVAAFERERVRDVFARFVPESVVDEVLDRAGGELRLGGIECDCTVMFSDLRGFTTFSEQTPAPRVIEILNRYMTMMSDAILDHGGTLVAYLGDGIMAVFGAPVPQDDHADRAVKAAREMLRRLDDFNVWLAEQGYEDGFRMGIGLNSGTVMSGNVGSQRRLEYTTIGDTTNTASRIEGMTKGTPHMLFIAASTVDRLRDREGLAFVGSQEVRGRKAPIELWAPELPVEARVEVPTA